MEMRTFTECGISLEYALEQAPEGGGRLPLLVWVPGWQDGNKETVLFWQESCRKRGIHFLQLEHGPRNAGWNDLCKTVQLLLYDIRKRCRVDVNRIYLAGYTGGTALVWQLLGRYPRMFAAALAIAGYGDPYRARNAKEIPVWVFWTREDGSMFRCPERGEGYWLDVGRMARKGNLSVGGDFLVQGLINIGADKVRQTGNLKNAQEALYLALRETVVDWLCSQNRKKLLWVEQIRTGVWRIDDYFMSSCYLVEGNERALLIDTGLGERNLREMAEKLTNRPVSLAVTHPHIDHMYHARLFDNIYIHHKAAARFPEIYEEMGRMDLSVFDSLHDVRCHPRGNAVVHALRNGSVIDLGGCRIETATLTGHTAYDCVFVDDSHRCVFTGDAVGSGYTVGIPMTKRNIEMRLRAYEEELGCFLDWYGERVNEYSFLGGHFIQENSCEDSAQEDYLSEFSSYFMPLSLQVVRDMKTLCTKILEGSCRNEESGDSYSWTFGCARISGKFSIGNGTEQ